MGEACNTHGINVKFILEFQSRNLKRLLARYRRRLEDIIKIGLSEILSRV
jgi:hypothetical protein